MTRQILIIFSGSAGTGKSFTLSVVKAIFGNSVLFLASTGKAVSALPFFATTIHSFLKINFKNTNSSLSEAVAVKLRDSLNGLRCIFIEEFSMV